MSESPETPQNPTDEDIDVEGPNESIPNQQVNPQDQHGDGDGDDSDAT